MSAIIDTIQSRGAQYISQGGPAGEAGGEPDDTLCPGTSWMAAISEAHFPYGNTPTYKQLLYVNTPQL